MLWALACARSRAINLPITPQLAGSLLKGRARQDIASPAISIGQGASLTVLVPLVDMLNHASTAVSGGTSIGGSGSGSSSQASQRRVHAQNQAANVCVELLPGGDGSVGLLPLHPLQAGEALWLDYGARGTVEWLSDYGFAVSILC